MGGGKLLLFLSFFSSVQINFQYKLNFHKSLFIVTVNLFSSIALLILFHQQVHCFFLQFFFIRLVNVNKCALFPIPCSGFNFNSIQEREQANIKCLQSLTLIRLGFLRVVFSGGGQFDLPSDFKKN